MFAADFLNDNDAWILSRIAPWPWRTRLRQTADTVAFQRRADRKTQHKKDTVGTKCIVDVLCDPAHFQCICSAPTSHHHTQYTPQNLSLFQKNEDQQLLVL